MWNEGVMYIVELGYVKCGVWVLYALQGKDIIIQYGVKAFRSLWSGVMDIME